jgi:uncharacterized membrane protein
MKLIFNYFFRGLLFVFPIFVTIYIIVVFVNWADDTLTPFCFPGFPFRLPGLGIVTAFFLIVFLGLP